MPTLFPLPVLQIPHYPVTYVLRLFNKVFLMRVVQIPTLFDNYTYLIICEVTGQAAIVDSPDAEATLAVIQKEKDIDPIAIFSTHHHLDHVGGNIDLLKYKKMEVYGGANDASRIPGLTHPLKEGDKIQLGKIRFSILDIPGHTRGHIAYVGPQSVFCGDTLFAGGCGRLFEGTPEQMFHSLSKLKNLPNDTFVYCGHEYTQKNLEFALKLEPKNEALQKKCQQVVALQQKNISTVPTTMAEEKSYNPFLRGESVELIESMKKKVPGLKTDAVSVFAAARKLKDNF